MKLATVSTRLFVLLGDPVEHSLSPRLHNAAMHATGRDGIYIALRCSSDDAASLLRGVARAGGGGNVTIPHKQCVLPALTRSTDAVRLTGACNLFWGEGGQVCGDNTDMAAFVAALAELVGAGAPDRVLVLGAGGAARAAVAGLLSLGVPRVEIRCRTAERGARLCSALDPDGASVRVVPSGDPAAGANYDLVVNATPLGLRAEDPLPIILDSSGLPGAVLDLVYAPGATPWVRYARELGIAAADGRRMLAHQAAAAYERWWSEPAPLEVISSEVEALE